MKNKLILIGGGGHCHSVIDVIEQLGNFEIVGILDIREKVGSNVMSYPIIGTDDEFEEYVKEASHAFITLGQIKSAELRKFIFEKLIALKFEIPNIISPLAYVSPSSNMGVGNFIGHHALINANAKIGNNCIINTKSLIEHDVVIGSHCHIATGATINGSCHVEDETFIGSSAVTKQGITISKQTFIKAGSVVK